MRVIVLTLLSIVPGAAGSWAQAPAAPVAGPTFDVASVRPAEPGGQGGISRPVNGIVRVNRAPLRRIIHFAFDIEPNLHDPPVVGGPSWIDSDLFVIEARGPAELSLAAARLMMQSLLRERFKLRARIEQRDVPIYALSLARSDRALGPGLRRSKVDCTAYSAALARSGRLEVARRAGPSECALNSGGGIGGGRLFVKGTATIRDMLTPLNRSPDVDRRIVDRTGLTATFDVDLVWAPSRSGPAAAAAADVVSLFTALREQLGLKLESAREPRGLVVIESVERPDPN